MRFDEETAETPRSLPNCGPVFPYLRSVRAGDRSTEFHQTLCWFGNQRRLAAFVPVMPGAERAKKAGYPERFAQEALGHNSKAVHRALRGRRQVELPPLGDTKSTGPNSRRAAKSLGPVARAVNA